MVERHPGEFVKRTNVLVLCLLALTALIFAVRPVHGQDLFGGSGEISATSGVAFGGIGPRPIVAGSAGADISHVTSWYGRGGVDPISSQTLLPAEAFTVRGSNLYDFNIAVQVHIPIRHWDPYGTLGTAVLMNPYTAGFLGPNGNVVYVGERHSKFGLQGGGGCRYYVGKGGECV